MCMVVKLKNSLFPSDRELDIATLRCLKTTWLLLYVQMFKPRPICNFIQGNSEFHLVACCCNFQESQTGKEEGSRWTWLNVSKTFSWLWTFLPESRHIDLHQQWWYLTMKITIWSHTTPLYHQTTSFVFIVSIQGAEITYCAFSETVIWYLILNDIQLKAHWTST